MTFKRRHFDVEKSKIWLTYLSKSTSVKPAFERHANGPCSILLHGKNFMFFSVLNLYVYTFWDFNLFMYK